MVILIFLFMSNLFSGDFSDYYGIWKGDVETQETKYYLYVNFPGIYGENNKYNKGNYNLRDYIRNINSEFKVKKSIKENNCYDVDIFTGKSVFTSIVFKVYACYFQNKIYLKSSWLDGEIMFENEEKKDVVIFKLKSFGNDVKGRLIKISGYKKTKPQKKHNKTPPFTLIEKKKE
ncbi:MAG: hypothetical protein N2Z60_02210 [Elusimicrobiales bacterium]|nr:hypothetical protein [Elusimicrobiales bacterium]